VERRAYPRYPCNLAIFCRPVAARREELWWPAEVRDISVGGLGLVLLVHFEPGTILAIELEGPAAPVPRLLLARVVHARPQPGGGWFIGCELADRLRDDELLRLLREAKTRPRRDNRGGDAAGRAPDRPE
jgi:hypothetical protein